MWPWMASALCWARREYYPTGKGVGRDRLVCNVLHWITLRWLFSMGDRWEGLQLHYNEFGFSIAATSMPVKPTSFKLALENTFTIHIFCLFVAVHFNSCICSLWCRILCSVICLVVTAPAQFTCAPSWFICFCPGICQ